jgi:hypothetical protein
VRLGTSRSCARWSDAASHFSFDLACERPGALSSVVVSASGWASLLASPWPSPSSPGVAYARADRHHGSVAARHGPSRGAPLRPPVVRPWCAGDRRWSARGARKGGEVDLVR